MSNAVVDSLNPEFSTALWVAKLSMAHFKEKWQYISNTFSSMNIEYWQWILAILRLWIYLSFLKSKPNFLIYISITSISECQIIRIKHIISQAAYWGESIISSFFGLSSCQLPDLLDMARADVPEWYCSRDNTRCSGPHPCSHVLAEPSEKAAHQTTVSYPGLWPCPPVAPFNLKAKQASAPGS